MHKNRMQFCAVGRGRMGGSGFERGVPQVAGFGGGGGAKRAETAEVAAGAGLPVRAAAPSGAEKVLAEQDSRLEVSWC